MSCRLLLVDDHVLIRAGLRALLADIPGYSVVAEGDDGSQLLDLSRRHRPDMVLLDLSMKSLGGLEALRALKRQAPAPRVLIVTMHSEPRLVMQALEAGADGYLLKDSSAAELEHALQSLRTGIRYLSPAVAGAVIQRALQPQARPAAQALTARQLEILRLIARGKATREIAQGLGLSIKTVETHRAQLMKRLQVFDVAGLALYAVREGIINLDD
ncbi:response regulator [Pseudomonas sp. NPDC007930]|uniref:response regulator n=1 Tax=Pseudomonas sp. NPDC007930 TaxID=3364417 RepID=UPI0036E8765A